MGLKSRLKRRKNKKKKKLQEKRMKGHQIVSRSSAGRSTQLGLHKSDYRHNTENVKPEYLPFGDENTKHDILRIWKDMDKEKKATFLSLGESDIADKFSDQCTVEERQMVSIEKNLSMCLEDETVRSAQAAVLDAIEDHLNSVEKWRKIEENPDIMYENQLNEKEKELRKLASRPIISVLIPRAVVKKGHTGRVHDTMQLIIFSAVLEVLMDKFMVRIEVEDLNTKIFIILSYFCFTMPYWFLSVPFLALFVFVEDSKVGRIKSQFSKLVELSLVHSKNPNVVNWSSSIYISSALLVLFNDDPRLYLVIGALTILPHLLDEITKRCLRDTSDENALRVLRALFVFANKLVLLYISWVTWSSLLLTTALFFKEIFVYILFALYTLSHYLFGVAFAIMRRLIPASWFNIFEHVVTSPIVRVQVHVAVFASTAYVFYTSSDWYGTYRTLARILSVVLSSVMFVDNTTLFPRVYEAVFGIVLFGVIASITALSFVVDAISGRCCKSKTSTNKDHDKTSDTNDEFKFVWEDSDVDEGDDGMSAMD